MGRLNILCALPLTLAACAPVADGAQAPAAESAGTVPVGTPPLDAPPAPPSTDLSEWRYEAGGTEPFWTLSAEGLKRGWTFELLGEPIAYGGLRDIERDEGRPTLRGRSSDGAVMELVSSPGPCSDGMSDRRFADSVTVRLGTATYRGCGGAILRPATLEGTSWTFLTLAGEPVRDRRAGLTFAEGGIQASVGCNSLSKRGTWRTNDRFVGPAAIGTQMGCGDLARQERDLGRLLGREVEAAFAPDGTMILTGGGVTATLKRVI